MVRLVPRPVGPGRAGAEGERYEVRGAGATARRGVARGSQPLEGLILISALYLDARQAGVAYSFSILPVEYVLRGGGACRSF